MTRRRRLRTGAYPVDISLLALSDGDPVRLRVLNYGDVTFDLLPYAPRAHRPQTRIRLDRAQADVLCAMLEPVAYVMGPPKKRRGK